MSVVENQAEELVSDNEIADVWGSANFGSATPREIIMETLLKYAADFSAGSTATRICADLGLLNGFRKGRKITLSKKGRRYMYYAVNAVLPRHSMKAAQVEHVARAMMRAIDIPDADTAMLDWSGNDIWSCDFGEMARAAIESIGTSHSPTPAQSDGGAHAEQTA